MFFGLGYWPSWYFPFYYGAPYYYPPYYSSPGAWTPSSPPVYIERESEPQSGYWYYYCTSPQGYYPYVTQCPGGWQRVKPEPP